MATLRSSFKEWLTSNKKNSRIQKRIQAFVSALINIQFFHIKRHNNKEADKLANIGAMLNYGDIVIDHPLASFKKRSYLV